MSLVPQLGLPEILVLAMLALLVIGPKDLPKFLHSVGKMVGKIRRLADEFRAGISQMAREAEMEEMRREIEELKKTAGADDVQKAFRDLESDVNSAVSVASSRPHPHDEHPPHEGEEQAGSDGAPEPEPGAKTSEGTHG
ncbi:Sec-independent protein translocase protein TatB [Parvularcula lutaonensis]|uniref:Sec-independent protein translocase protein TatB n=1 Tax=Parvularcula lutaonensis TaxID=491923 RepID=A0ABV7MD16_9PROT|nr:Sec-independent protein translocase protein TatB [Parvularcula lutaonensis]GGY39400.1 hypothetical protein GCM10007148_04640 [Parvularcula lutaonensis]